MTTDNLPQGMSRLVPGARTGQVSRRVVLGAVPLAAAAVGLAGCGFSGSGGDGGNGGGGGGGGRLSDTLREARRPANHLNPVFGGGGSPQATILGAMIWEGLVRRDPNNSSEYLPGVAESWDVSEDGLTYTFKLRDAKWNNGEPLTAEQVVWSFSYFYSPKLGDQGNENPPSHKGDADNCKITGMADYYGGKTDDFSTVGVKAPDAKTVEVTLTEPDPFFLDSTVRIYPLDQASVEANVQDFWMPDNLVSNGPYTMTKYSQNSAASFELNEHYWDKASFSVTKREVQFNSSGATGMMVSYNAGEIDTFRVDGDPTALIAGRKDLEEQLVRGSLVQFKGLQVMPSANPILTEKPKLREALALALDREALASVSPPDVAGPSFVPSDITGADQLPAIPFDVDKAKSLMAEAGHADGKGIPKLTILTYATMPVLEAAAEMWGKNLGLDVSVSVQEVGVYGNMLNGDRDENYCGFAFNYQAPSPFNIIRYGASATPYFPRTAIPYEIDKQIFDFTRGKDKGKYSPAEEAAKIEELTSSNWTADYKKFADLNKEAQAAFADTERATELATEACKAFQATYYWIPLLWAGYTFMVKPRIKNMIPTSYPDNIYTMKGVTLDPVEG